MIETAVAYLRTGLQLWMLAGVVVLLAGIVEKVIDYEKQAEKLQADLDATGPLIRWYVKREVGRVGFVLVVHAQAYPESSCYFTVPTECLDDDTVAQLVNTAVKDMMGGA